MKKQNGFIRKIKSLHFSMVIGHAKKLLKQSNKVWQNRFDETIHFYESKEQQAIQSHRSELQELKNECNNVVEQIKTRARKVVEENKKLKGDLDKKYTEFLEAENRLNEMIATLESIEAPLKTAIHSANKPLVILQRKVKDALDEVHSMKVRHEKNYF